MARSHRRVRRVCVVVVFDYVRAWINLARVTSKKVFINLT